MLKRTADKVIVFLLTVMVSSVVVFLLLSALPGDAASTALGTDASPAAVAAKRHELGLDQPLMIRYWNWISNMLHGNMGISAISGVDIATDVFNGLQVTLILVLTAILIALFIAFLFGISAARFQGKTFGFFISVLSQIGVSIPSFLAGLILVIIFAVHLQILPATGWVPLDNLRGFLSHLILPALSLGVVQGAILSRYVRSAVLEVMRDDFMRTARAKGLSRSGALWRHGIRNALVPILNISGIEIASMLIGAVVVERVFEIRGLGSLLVSSVENRDLPEVQSIVMVLVVIVLLVNLAVDLLSAVIDPRIRGMR